MKTQAIHITITVLCCLLTVFATLAVKAWTMDEKYALKDEVKSIEERVAKLRSENREDHKDIQSTLQAIANTLGRLEAMSEHKSP